MTGEGFNVSVTAIGPVFNGQLQRAIVAGTHEGLVQLGDDAKVNILQVFSDVLRTHPTMRLEGGVRVRPVGADFIVDDGGVIYGSWIEGLGSRNRTSRFKGYATYRRVTQALNLRAAQVVAKAIARRIGSL
jgi:hypothetical protein